MDIRNAYLLIEILGKTGVREIDILGGEPMLVPWMMDFVKYAAGSGISLNISTNGSRPDVLNEIAEARTGSLNVGFSILGFCETHNALTGVDTFSRAIAGLRLMIAAGKKPVAKTVLLRENIQEICELAAYLAGCGLEKYYLLHEDIIGRQDLSASFSFPEFWNFYSKVRADMEGLLDIGFVAASGFYKYGPHSRNRCDAGVTKLAIMPDGSAFPCNLFSGFGEFFLGNIFTDGIEKIWSNPVLENFRKHDGNKRCGRNNCSHYLTCRGGCPAHCYYFYGSLDMPDPRCEISNPQKVDME